MGGDSWHLAVKVVVDNRTNCFRLRSYARIQRFVLESTDGTLQKAERRLFGYSVNSLISRPLQKRSNWQGFIVFDQWLGWAQMTAAVHSL